MLQGGFLGLCGEKVDAINYYREKISELDEKVISASTLFTLAILFSNRDLFFLLHNYGGVFP